MSAAVDRWLRAAKQDVRAYGQGIKALRHLYDPHCDPEHYEDDCISCRAGRMIRDLEEGLASTRVDLVELEKEAAQ